MTETTIRQVDQLDLERALDLLEAVGLLNQRTQLVNVYPLQMAISSISEDMVAYAKELLKTPPPVVEPLLGAAAKAADAE